ncbi:30S ribosomal protein S1 [Helicobacter winghamensis]|uniref:30S ribosomal protein S1 n=1 Tax=Helicobacter winghamensis TaxID=157268 RepID=A0A2N3PI13_9HELI|nr:30S ribosomal protein S1 [Helicobacter winghamensis]EEO26148.1 putative ribosomal protein S1 [Helicobacter winghamensis ATCC BAA-430]PKT75713.1 30S ribosomal protein S1 [Helicobacter winghamensis]PKT80305.1 30S ribosomal protein S1 [Helicobacter winghamensis]PKT80670.1 30S ribosomal protein S1 [Helicobacter winghamensis]
MAVVGINTQELEKIIIDDNEDFAAMFEQFEKKESTRVSEGNIVAIENNQVVIAVPGEKKEGIVALDEILDAQGNLLFKVGDTLPIVITGRRNEQPIVSYKKAIRKEKVRQYIQSLGDDYKDKIVEGVVVRRNKGGYVVESGDIEFFMPKFTAAFKEGSKIEGKKIKACIINVKPEEDSIVISRKRLFELENTVRKDAVENLLKENGTLEGKVKKITSFGMFVDVNGVEGLVHYTEISYKGPVNPSKLYKEDDIVPIKVLNYDKDKRRLALSIKATAEDPWREVENELEVGDAIKVTVSNIEPYGVFVDLGNDIEGFLHISEISWNKNIQNPEEFLKVGQEIDVEVIEIDSKDRRLRVSLKKLLDKPFEQFAKKHKEGEVLKGVVATLTDFGAFVKLDGIDGLLHNEDAYWNKNEKCKDLMKIGESVEVKIAKIDRQKERVSLTRKGLIASPVDEFAKKYSIDDAVIGTVRDVKDFGVFIKIDDEMDALIRNEDLPPLKKEEIKIGDKINGVISLIDAQNNRIRVSVRRLERQKEKANLKSFNDNASDKMTLGDIIKDQIS